MTISPNFYLTVYLGLGFRVMLNKCIDIVFAYLSENLGKDPLIYRHKTAPLGNY
jgi:hypothetical protein